LGLQTVASQRSRVRQGRQSYADNNPVVAWNVPTDSPSGLVRCARTPGPRRPPAPSSRCQAAADGEQIVEVEELRGPAVIEPKLHRCRSLEQLRAFGGVLGHAPGDAALAPSAQIFNMLMLELLRATVHRGWTKTRELGDETKTERVD